MDPRPEGSGLGRASGSAKRMVYGIVAAFILAGVASALISIHVLSAAPSVRLVVSTGRVLRAGKLLALSAQVEKHLTQARIRTVGVSEASSSRHLGELLAIRLGAPIDWLAPRAARVRVRVSCRGRRIWILEGPPRLGGAFVTEKEGGITLYRPDCPPGKAHPPVSTSTRPAVTRTGKIRSGTTAGGARTAPVLRSKRAP